MSDDLPRISLSFGAFACEIEGIDDPLPLLQRLIALCEEVEKRNPDFGRRVIPLDELNVALQTEGPITARVEDDTLILSSDGQSATAPARSAFAFSRTPDTGPAQTDEIAPAPLEGEISSLKEIEENAQELPQDQLASALDRAMTAGPAAAAAKPRASRPVLGVADYASPRMPRNALHAIEIAAAWRHHIQDQSEFDRSTLLSDAALINTRQPQDEATRAEAFDTLIAQAVLRAVDESDRFTLSPAVVDRYAR